MRGVVRAFEDGLGIGTRILIAAAAALGAVVMILSAPRSDRPDLVYTCAAFLGLIVVASVGPRPLARAAGRIIGAFVFVACVWGLSSTLISDESTAWQMVRAGLFFGSVGLAGAHYAFKGRFRNAEPEPVEEEVDPYRRFEDGTYDRS